MESRAHALVAGLFVVLFACGALFTLWWFGGQHEAFREVTVVSREAITGLNPQAVVRYRGVRVGKVDEIAFDRNQPGEILIRLSVDNAAPLTDKTVARMAFQGVTGIAYIQLDDLPGPAQPLTGEARKIPLLPSLVSEGIDAGFDTLRQVKEVTVRVNALLDEENRGRIARSLANLERLSGHAAKAGEQLPEVLSRLNRLASDENLSRLSATLRNSADTTAQAGEALRDVRQLAASLRAVSERLESVLSKVDGEALASAPGKLGEMADQVKQAAASVDRVARALEERPEGLLFGKDKRGPGPGENGFSTGGRR